MLNHLHDYSPLWLRAFFIPTDKTWTMPIGLAVILGFLLSLFWVVKPFNWREVIILSLPAHQRRFSTALSVAMLMSSFS